MIGLTLKTKKMKTPEIILEHTDITNKIKRIGYQIVERYYDHDELYLVGIESKGQDFAKLLSEAILKAQPKKTITIIKLSIDKKRPHQQISTDIDVSELEQKNIIVIDDVLNSGRTLIYATNYFLQANPKSLSTAVLVDRNHKTFPIKADFKGISLSTSMKNHVEVYFNGNSNMHATLS